LFPFSASIKKARFTRAYLTRHLPPTGFLTLPTVCFLLDPLALFHASNTLGILSSGRFPPNRAFYIFRCRRPSWRWIVPTETGSALTFKVFFPAGIRHSPELLALLEKAAALLIFNSLRSSPGLPWPAIHDASPPELLRMLEPRPSHRMPYRVLRNNPVGWSSKRLPPFLSFLHLVSDPPVRPPTRPSS